MYKHNLIYVLKIKMLNVGIDCLCGYDELIKALFNKIWIDKMCYKIRINTLQIFMHYILYFKHITTNSIIHDILIY